MKAPRTIFRRPLALLRWYRTDGNKRLRAARLRRAGNPTKALILFTGAWFLIELIRMTPDPIERKRFIESACRKLSAGLHFKEMLP